MATKDIKFTNTEKFFTGVVKEIDCENGKEFFPSSPFGDGVNLAVKIQVLDGKSEAIVDLQYNKIFYDLLEALNVPMGKIAKKKGDQIANRLFLLTFVTFVVLVSEQSNFNVGKGNATKRGFEEDIMNRLRTLKKNLSEVSGDIGTKYLGLQEIGIFGSLENAERSIDRLISNADMALKLWDDFNIGNIKINYMKGPRPGAGGNLM